MLIQIQMQRSLIDNEMPDVCSIKLTNEGREINNYEKIIM